MSFLINKVSFIHLGEKSSCNCLQLITNLVHVFITQDSHSSIPVPNFCLRLDSSHHYTMLCQSSAPAPPCFPVQGSAGGCFCQQHHGCLSPTRSPRLHGMFFSPDRNRVMAAAVSPGHAACASGFEDHTGIPHAKGEFPAGTIPTSTVSWHPQSCRTIVLNSNCLK